MISNVSFRGTFVDEPLRNRMLYLEQRKPFIGKQLPPLVTTLVKNLNEDTEKTGDTAYLSTVTVDERTQRPLINEDNESIITLDIINKAGEIIYHKIGAVNNSSKRIEFHDPHNEYSNRYNDKFNIKL